MVYVPEARVAWTGNLILGEGTIPFLIEGGAGAYLQTVSLFAQELDVNTIAPGHGPLTTGAILGRYAHYLTELIESVRQSIRSGQKVEELVTRHGLTKEHMQSQENLTAAGVPSKFLEGLHNFNLTVTYQEMNPTSKRASANDSLMK